MIDPKTMISMALSLQSFFDQTLLAKLVEKEILTADDAHEMALETATFAHELSDEPHRMEAAIYIAQGFERMARDFAE